MAIQAISPAETISYFCGWIYFFAWSLSFYPQPALNLQRRTTEGLTPDYPILNVFGFASYTISTAAFLYSPLVRAQYASRHPASPEPTVRVNDLAFGLHACVLTVVTLSQFWPRLWGWRHPTVKRRPTRVTLVLLWGGIAGIAICVSRVLTDGNASNEDGNVWGWIDVMYAMTYVKLLLTIFKYIPQVVSNHQRKSTLGWSIGQVQLDFLGGIFSLLQLFIDASLQADWSGLTGNPVKLGLANVSLMFDIIFLFQHYALYGPVPEKRLSIGSEYEVGSEDEPLLG